MSSESPLRKRSHGQDTGDINPLQETIGQKKMICVFLTPVVSLALLVLSVPDTDGEDRSICRIDRVQQLLLNDDLIESLHGATRKLNQFSIPCHAKRVLVTWTWHLSLTA